MPIKKRPIRVHHDNLAKHGVEPEEIYECFLTVKSQFVKKAARGAWQMIAQTSAGRYLEMAYEIWPDEIWVFHAMDARKHQVRLLKRKRRGR